MRRWFFKGVCTEVGVKEVTLIVFGFGGRRFIVCKILNVEMISFVCLCFVRWKWL